MAVAICWIHRLRLVPILRLQLLRQHWAAKQTSTYFWCYSQARHNSWLAGMGCDVEGKFQQPTCTHLTSHKPPCPRRLFPRLLYVQCCVSGEYVALHRIEDVLSIMLRPTRTARYPLRSAMALHLSPEIHKSAIRSTPLLCLHHFLGAIHTFHSSDTLRCELMEDGLAYSF